MLRSAVCEPVSLSVWSSSYPKRLSAVCLPNKTWGCQSYAAGLDQMRQGGCVQGAAIRFPGFEKLQRREEAREGLPLSEPSLGVTYWAAWKTTVKQLSE